MSWFLVLIAVSIGVASTVQAATNGTLAGRTALSSAVLVNAVVVMVAALAWWLVKRPPLLTAPASPWWLYLGGVYGMVIIAGAAFAFPRLGAGPTTALVLTAQLTTALLLDHLGVPGERLPVTGPRLLGALLLLAGALLVLWPKLAAARAR